MIDKHETTETTGGRGPVAPAGPSEKPRALVLAASPRRGGTCAALAPHVAAGLRDAGCDACVRYLADYAPAGCTGCGACERTGACALDACELEGARGGGRPGFSALIRELEAADALALVAPVYFSGPPSQLKALFDRLQPFWAQRYVLGTRPSARPLGQRKPFDLVAVGTGKDPFGHEALVSCARSALRMLDFELHELRGAVGLDPAAPAVQEAARMWGKELAARL